MFETPLAVSWESFMHMVLCHYAKNMKGDYRLQSFRSDTRLRDAATAAAQKETAPTLSGISFCVSACGCTITVLNWRAIGLLTSISLLTSIALLTVWLLSISLLPISLCVLAGNFAHATSHDYTITGRTTSSWQDKKLPAVCAGALFLYGV